MRRATQGIFRRMMTLAACAALSQTATANPQPSAKQSVGGKKVIKPLPLLDRAWLQRKDPLIKKLAFVEQLQKDIDTQLHNKENQSRMMMSQAIVLISDENSRMAAVELIKQAAETSPLKLTSQAASLVWNEFQNHLKISDSTNYNALADVAWAISTTGHTTQDPHWLYFVALSAANRGDSSDALNWFGKTEPSSALFRHAKLQEGLLSAAAGNAARAKNSLEIVMSLELTAAEKMADLKKEALVSLKEIAALNLARLMFENKEFKDALSLYRSIDAQSPLFYESLSEQGWAFFMAGHPNRALGSEYGATSPFFNDRFQPDQFFLSAAVNYWLCDFKAARRNIHAFVIHTKEDAALLRKWNLASAASAEQHKALVQKAFSVAENLVHGVSAANNSLGPRGLQSLSKKTNIIRRLAQLEKIRSARLEITRANWPMRSKKTVVQSLLRREEAEQKHIGTMTLALIAAMQSDYERAVSQLRLIQLEIMTAEKDKLMNRDRSSAGQEFLGSEEEFLEAVQQSAQVWSNEKKEFWKDELDSFIFSKRSQCQQQEGEDRKNVEK